MGVAIALVEGSDSARASVDSLTGSAHHKAHFGIDNAGDGLQVIEPTNAVPC